MEVYYPVMFPEAEAILRIHSSQHGGPSSAAMSLRDLTGFNNGKRDVNNVSHRKCWFTFW